MFLSPAESANLRRALMTGLTALLMAQENDFILPASWSLFAVDGLYNIYGWDKEARALYKLWAPRYDSLTRIGGVPGMEGFLDVTAIAPLGNQQVYVLDPAGQKVFLLGTNLQPLQRLSYDQLPTEVVEGYPVLLAARESGELYLLLRETQEIVKIDAFGRVILRFGGKIYGVGSISGAAGLYAEGDRVYVVDTVQHRLIEYDSWGSFIQEEHFPDTVQGVFPCQAGKALWGGNQITWKGKIEQTFSASEPVRAVWVQNQRLYWIGKRRGGWFLIP